MMQEQLAEKIRRKPTRVDSGWGCSRWEELFKKNYGAAANMCGAKAKAYSIRF
jgi:hypothetical protein